MAVCFFGNLVSRKSTSKRIENGRVEREIARRLVVSRSRFRVRDSRIFSAVFFWTAVLVTPTSRAEMKPLAYVLGRSTRPERIIRNARVTRVRSLHFVELHVTRRNSSEALA